MEFKYLLYFLTGGVIVSVVTYFASQAKGLLAAFFANMPAITLITFLLVYHESGQKEVVLYAKGMMVMLLPWLAYIFSIIFLTERLGFIPSLAIGFSLYLSLALLIMGLKKI
jgi:uncharacterized membrane protein (GlpM family)